MAGPTTAERGGPKASKPAGAAKSSKPSASGPSGTSRGLWFRRRPVLLGLAAAVLLAGGGTWALYGSSWLRVEKVGITGTEVLTPEQVRVAAAVPLGAPMAAVDTDEIEARLRGRLPRIDSVDVVRAWPHGIGLKVTERKPVLLIEKGAKFVEVDASGVRFATVPKAPEGVPVLELTAKRSPSLRRFDEERLLHEAVGVADDLPAAVARDTRVVRVRSYDAVVLELTGGRTVMWGSPEQGAAKGRALTALMKAAGSARHFDVSAPTAPAASGS
ncbi:cell division protein FtsQ/DivIB [Streptomyces sp. NPDC086023]|uniref:cell division protein FtsQ/DivIB n=1 Tax=Streptomyces sp. NPDC086023 TaxID=3365746 RepID=UPI0037CE1198